MAKRSKEKSAKREQNKDRRPRAIARYIRISPSKCRIALNLVRGKSYAEALAILENTHKAASLPIIKVLNSAAANAENNLNLSKDSLFVAEIKADPGPTFKRFRPVGRGRAHKILKRSSHITVILESAL
jgi:large subunit ribosomal protein L22